MISKAKYSLAIGALAFAGVAVAAAAMPGTTTAHAHAHAKGSAQIDVSRVKDYSSFAQLRRESAAVAMATAGSSRPYKVNGVPATVTTVRIERAAWGAAPSSIDVLQLGGSGVNSPETSQLLVGGQRYVLFVTPYHLTPSDHTGLYVITGDQGVFKLSGSDLAFSGGGEPRFARHLPLAGWISAVTS